MRTVAAKARIVRMSQVCAGWSERSVYENGPALRTSSYQPYATRFEAKMSILSL